MSWASPPPIKTAQLNNATHPNATVCFNASDMILYYCSDAPLSKKHASKLPDMSTYDCQQSTKKPSTLMTPSMSYAASWKTLQLK